MRDANMFISSCSLLLEHPKELLKEVRKQRDSKSLLQYSILLSDFFFFCSSRFFFPTICSKIKVKNPLLDWCSSKSTVFENHRKSLIQHCERSKLRVHLEWTKVL